MFFERETVSGIILLYSSHGHKTEHECLILSGSFSTVFFQSTCLVTFSGVIVVLVN